MEQRLFRNSAKILAFFCIFVSLISQNFHFVALTAFVIAGCFFAMGHAQSLEYDHERAYPVFAFNNKAELFCNIGWIGLILLSVFLMDHFFLASIKMVAWNSIISSSAGLK